MGLSGKDRRGRKRSQRAELTRLARGFKHLKLQVAREGTRSRERGTREDRRDGGGA